MKPMFYFLLASTAVLAVTARLFDPVLDTDGDIISKGSYYVLPRSSGSGGGGLTFSFLKGSSSCPLYLEQIASETFWGEAIRFSNWRSRVKFVPESTDLNIQLAIIGTVCSMWTYWYVPSVEPGTVIEASFIASGPKPLNGSFRIEKIEDALGGYKIVFCFKTSDCSDIGIVVDEYGTRRLALSSTPFEVRFMKSYTKTETSSKPMSII